MRGNVRQSDDTIRPAGSMSEFEEIDGLSLAILFEYVWRCVLRLHYQRSFKLSLRFQLAMLSVNSLIKRDDDGMLINTPSKVRRLCAERREGESLRALDIL